MTNGYLKTINTYYGFKIQITTQLTRFSKMFSWYVDDGEPIMNSEWYETEEEALEVAQNYIDNIIN